MKRSKTPFWETNINPITGWEVPKTRGCSLSQTIQSLPKRLNNGFESMFQR